MEKKIIVEGMVCSGCENRVKNALKTLPEVEDVDINGKDVSIKLNKEVNDDVIRETITDLGFDVKEV